jgi:hypothetical protein
MKYIPRNVRLAYKHAGLTHFGGTYFFHEFIRVLQLRDFIARHLAYQRCNCIEFESRSHWKAEATLVKIHRLLHEL